jgi:outer membrane protein TolC
MQDVYRSYRNYQTAEQSWTLSWDLLATATELRDITLARYKEGIGSILDVLSVQSQYRSATQQHIESRYSLLLARADLIRSIGRLNLDSAGGLENMEKLKDMP